MSPTLQAGRQRGFSDKTLLVMFCGPFLVTFPPSPPNLAALQPPQSCAAYHQPQDSSPLIINTLSPFLPRFSSALRTTNLETLEGYTQEKSKELSAETLKELQVGARRGCEAG